MYFSGSDHQNLAIVLMGLFFFSFLIDCYIGANREGFWNWIWFWANGWSNISIPWMKMELNHLFMSLIWYSSFDSPSFS